MSPAQHAAMLAGLVLLSAFVGLSAPAGAVSTETVKTANLAITADVASAANPALLSVVCTSADKVQLTAAYHFTDVRPLGPTETRSFTATLDVASFAPGAFAPNQQDSSSFQATETDFHSGMLDVSGTIATELDVTDVLTIEWVAEAAYTSSVGSPSTSTAENVFTVACDSDALGADVHRTIRSAVPETCPPGQCNVREHLPSG